MRQPYTLSSIFLGVAALVSAPFQVAQALSAPEISTIAEAITVRIEGQNPGSGVLIKQQGDVYTVLTAKHVVATEDEYEVVTPDQQRYLLDYQRVQKFPEVDLALVEFTSSKSYQVADLGDSGEVKSGMSVYVSGFPRPTAAITEPIRNFTPGSVTANANRPLDAGYALVYTNTTLPGMSGGPVLDEQGKLVGIHGRADAEQQVQQTETVYVKTGFNLGIPIKTFLNSVEQVNPALGFVGKSTPTLTSEPTADDWYLSAGDKYIKGDYRGAIADFNQAIQLNPEFAFAYNDRGTAHYGLGNYRGAIADYDKAIQIDPEYAGAYYNRGIARSEIGDQQGAIADYNKAIQIDPKYAEAYSSRGNARLILGDKQGAIADYDKAIQIDHPELAKTYNNRGAARSEIGDQQGAIADYDKAIQIDPEYADAYNNRGTTRSKLGDQQGAIEDLDKAIQINPKYAEAYISRGIARAALGDQRGAVEDSDKAIQINPKLAEAYISRGNARLKLRDKQGALADYDKAIQINPGYAPAWYNRACAYSLQANVARAIEDLQKAIKLDSKFRENAKADPDFDLIRNDDRFKSLIEP